MTLASTTIVLYDIPSLLPEREGFSPFVNTVRAPLLYKRLAFTTEYLEFADPETECKRLGIPPTAVKTNADALRDTTDGKSETISDSIKIIDYLEATYPDPDRPLFPGLSSVGGVVVSAPALHLLADQKIMSAFLTVFPLLVEDMHQLIPDQSKEFWRGTFLRRSGAAEWKDVVLAKDGAVYEQSAKAMVAAFEGIADALLHNATASLGSPKWFMGNKPTYTDLKLRSVLNFVRLISPDTWAFLKDIRGGIFEEYLAAWVQLMST